MRLRNLTLLFYHLRTFVNILVGVFLIISQVAGQPDTTSLPYTSYRFHPIVFGDIGFSDAPANIKYPYNDQISKIQYRHNNKMMLGVGFSYRWFSLRVGAALIGNSRPVAQYGKSKYIDVGTQFSVKKVYAEIDLRVYSGYVLRNAFLWDSTYSLADPNDKNQNINVYNIAAKMWYLHNRNFRMDPFTGNRGVYNKQVMTWYLAGRLDLYGIRNQSGPLVPITLRDTTNSKTDSWDLSAIEFGVIPGFGYVNRVKRFQFGFMAALGPRLQLKSYKIGEQNTSLAGIVARYDFKAIMGYNVPKFFAMVHIEVDNKSIHFSDLKYNQTFFYFKIQTGYRFNERLPKKKKKN